MTEVVKKRKRSPNNKTIVVIPVRAAKEYNPFYTPSHPDYIERPGDEEEVGGKKWEEGDDFYFPALQTEKEEEEDRIEYEKIEVIRRETEKRAESYPYYKADGLRDYSRVIAKTKERIRAFLYNKFVSGEISQAVWSSIVQEMDSIRYV